MEERILQDPILIGILSEYTRFTIKEGITRIYEILVQDIGSAKNISETSSLQFKIGCYSNLMKNTPHAQAKNISIKD